MIPCESLLLEKLLLKDFRRKIRLLRYGESLKRLFTEKRWWKSHGLLGGTIFCSEVEGSLNVSKNWIITNKPYLMDDNYLEYIRSNGSIRWQLITAS